MPLTVQEFAVNRGADVYAYVGYITRGGYNKLTKIAADKRNPRAYLLLATYGGDPDAGFRIARALRHYYEHLTIIIPSFCKSAGTLIAIGADDLVIADKGELGPLDMQLKKPDELNAMSSGLEITQAMYHLRFQAGDIFRETLVSLNEEFGITTRTALDMASKMAQGLVTPILSQIDPNKIGESQRAISVAVAYGERLNEKSKNLKDGALRKLVTDYPAHGFVIDRKEASKLFETVRAPDSDEAQLLTDSLYGYCDDPRQDPPIVVLFDMANATNPPRETPNEGHASGQDSEGSGPAQPEGSPGSEQDHEGDQSGPDSGGQ